MNVANLIVKLLTLDPNLEVTFFDADTMGDEPIDNVDVIKQWYAWDPEIRGIIERTEPIVRLS